MKKKLKFLCIALCIIISFYTVSPINASAVAANGRAVLLGVTNNGHNHTSCLNTISTNLENCSFTPYTIFSTTTTVNTILNCLDFNTNTIFVSRSHAYYNGSFLSQTSTYIKLNDSPSVTFSSLDIPTTKDLSNLKLAMFIGCYTGLGGSSEPNLVNTVVARGATTAVGFKQEISCSGANLWTKNFFELMEDGYTVYDACSLLSASDNFMATPLAEITICGYKYLTIN